MPQNERPQFAWTDGPPPTIRQPRIELERTPKGGATLRFLVLSDKIIGHNTHWNGWRTMPCLLPNCKSRDALGNHQVPTWHGWVAGLKLPSEEIILWEMTLPVAERFQKALTERGTIRGLEVRAKRRNKEDNAIIAVTITTLTPEPPLPKAPDVMMNMLRIWQLDTTDQERSPGSMKLTEAEQVQLEIANGTRGADGKKRTPRMELSRRRGRVHNVHLGPQPIGSLLKKSTTLRTKPDATSDEEPLPNNRAKMAKPHTNGAPKL